MSAFRQWRYWSHWWGLKDMTGHNYFNPTSLHSRDCKLTTWGVWNGYAGLWINFWSDHVVLNRCCETLGIPHARDPTPLLSCWMSRKSCSNKLTWNHSENPLGEDWLWPPSPMWECWAVKSPRMSNTWHKEQTSVWMYKHWRTFIKCFIFDIFIRSKENIGWGKTKAPWYYKHII